VIASTAAQALVAGLALVACAEPTPRPAVAEAPAAASEPTPAAALRRAPEIVSDDDPRVAAALARGRAAFDAKDFGAALLAFDEAHAVAPDSAKVLSELGWAAFHTGDLPRAQSELARAVELATDAKIAGAAWYSLGRVREAQGERDAAATAYETSLRLRDNGVVRRRLALLRTPPDGAKPRLDVERLAGPVPALLSWCVDEAQRDGMPVEQLDCDLEILDDDGIAVRMPASLGTTMGILEAKFVSRLRNAEYQAVHLALRTSAGWFVGREIGSHGMAGVGGIHFQVEHLAIEVVDLHAGDGPELLVRVHSSTTDLGTDGEPESSDDLDDRIVCGLGPTDLPACTSPIPVVGTSSWIGDDGRHVETRWSFRLEVVEGAVVLTGDRTALDEHHRAWLGKHVIDFSRGRGEQRESNPRPLEPQSSALTD
jgi:hypothetical protein